MVKTVKKKNVQKKLIKRRNILKGAKTAWIFFCDENRDKILKENPDLAFGDVCKKLAPMWNNLTLEEKHPYVQMHLKDKLRYQNKLKNLSEEEKRQLRRYRRYKRSMKKNKPKSALSPYMFFVIEKRSDIVKEEPDADFRTIGRLLGKRWKEMSSKDKDIYYKRSELDKERYTREKQQYLESKKHKSDINKKQ